jgi:hypothetical protein
MHTYAPSWRVERRLLTAQITMSAELQADNHTFQQAATPPRMWTTAVCRPRKCKCTVPSCLFRPDTSAAKLISAGVMQWEQGVYILLDSNTALYRLHVNRALRPVNAGKPRHYGSVRYQLLTRTDATPFDHLAVSGTYFDCTDCHAEEFQTENHTFSQAISSARHGNCTPSAGPATPAAPAVMP